MTSRLEAKIRRDFGPGSADAVAARLASINLPLAEKQDPERIQAAIVLLANGSWPEFTRAIELAETDWRDVLVASGLGNEDWPERLDVALAT